MDSEYLPIDAYGIIGNDNRAALVGRNGSIDWCPFPHVESPSVFSAILDDDSGGHFRIEPATDYAAEQSYVDETNVLRTTFETDDGTATITDFMPVRSGESPDERFQQAIYRKVEAREGTVELDVAFAPRFDYARVETTLEPTDDGDVVARPEDGHFDDGSSGAENTRTDRAEPSADEMAKSDPNAASADEMAGSDSAESPADELDDENGSSDGGDGDGSSGGGDGGGSSGDGEIADRTSARDRDQERLYLHGDGDLEVTRDATARGSLSMDAGTVHWFCCQYGAPDFRPTSAYQSILEETIDYWRTWLADCEGDGTDLLTTESAWQAVLTRSALVLKLLIHDETGAIPAAPTTSLPEEIGSGLNWDYRYNWIRDAKFTVQALYTVGQEREARAYFEWFRSLGHDEPAELQPLYDLHGEAAIDEETLDHLEGYRDSRPIRIGNAAAEQTQLDIYGTIIQGIYETVRFENGLTDDDWSSVRALAEHICEHWDETGESIWEFRDLHEHFVHSKLLCWVGLDRALALAEEYDRDGPLDRWDETRTAIREAIETRGYDEEAETFRQFFDAKEAVDATALLIPLYGFLPPDDDRVLGTIETVLEELTTEDGLVVRFANSPARPRESGAFVLCSCWLIDALVLADQVEEAREYFDALLEYASPLGLYAEMIHTDDGTFLGNYPQAFSHIGVLNSAVYLAGEDEEIGEILPADLDAGQTAPLFRRHDG